MGHFLIRGLGVLFVFFYFTFVYLFIFIYFFCYRKVRKVLTGVLPLMLVYLVAVLL